jgi:hypothetical protein
MADPLYLSLWFPRLEFEELLPRTVAVMRQFPFSEQWPGITYMALHPMSWNEATILEHRFRPTVPPEEAGSPALRCFCEGWGSLICQKICPLFAGRKMALP